MATLEDKGTEIDIGSDDIERTYICQPCEDDGEEHTAVGYCVNCREYLCQRCFECHLVPTLTKRHELLDIDHIIETENKYPCEQHRDKEIEYHCPTHSFFGCHVCYFQHQESCKDTICIQEVSTSTASSDDVEKFNKEQGKIINKCTKLQREIKQNRETVNSNHKEAIETIKLFIKDILYMIGTLEKDLVDKVDTIKNEDRDKLDSLSQRVRAVLKETQKKSATIDKLQGMEKAKDLYIELTTTRDMILRQEDQIQVIEAEKRIRNFKFKANRNLEEILKSPFGLGSLRSTITIEDVTSERDIKCKSANDASDCLVYGMVMLDDQKLILTDRGSGNTVKCIDMNQNKILHDLKLSSSSYGICKINYQLVAVTLPDGKKIALLRTDPSLGLEKEITVGGNPHGIDYLDGKLVVSYAGNSSKVEIIDIQGNVINTIDKDSNGQPLFYSPYHLAINSNKRLIYVSNYNSDSVVCMNFVGTVMAIYKDRELNKPRQVAFDRYGMVYVCGENLHNVHQITEDCKKVKVVLTRSHGLSLPWSICFQEKEERFVIGQSNNVIKVYQVSYTKI